MPRFPFSIRRDSQSVQQYQELYEGVPAWMVQAAVDWASFFFVTLDAFGRHAGYRIEVLQAAEQYLRFPLNWRQGPEAALSSLLQLLNNNDKGPDLLDFCLQMCQDVEIANQLELTLAMSGSAYTVQRDPNGQHRLESRVNETLRDMAGEAMAPPDRVSEYLRRAWRSLYGRDPDPSAAHRDAVRALEAAARPILTPNDPKATLGKMIKAVADRPAKWAVAIGEVGTVLMMLQTVWEAQHDRHGTNEANRPANVIQQEADAALHFTVTLVHLFRSKAIRLL